MVLALGDGYAGGGGFHYGRTTEEKGGVGLDVAHGEAVDYGDVGHVDAAEEAVHHGVHVGVVGARTIFCELAD